MFRAKRIFEYSLSNVRERFSVDKSILKTNPQANSLPLFSLTIICWQKAGMCALVRLFLAAKVFRRSLSGSK